MSTTKRPPLPSSGEAPPDLQIIGNDITFRPSGYDEPPSSATRSDTFVAKQDSEPEALMRNATRFRREPLQFLREISLSVSGTGWRAYENPIGQPIYYAGFSEQMKNRVLFAPLLRRRIEELASTRLEFEKEEGRFAGKDPDGAEAERRRELERSLQEVAAKWTDQMICKFESRPFIRGAYYLVTQLLTRAYHQGIHVSSEEVLRLRQVAAEAQKKKQSIVFLPCHRSHVDYVSLQLICYRLGIALPVVVAGDNLNLVGLGSFLQHAGAMWIRRSFGDDVLYTTLVQTYIDALLQGGYNFECFIEGGRSRTGKLLSPKFGILSFLVDSLLSGRVEDAIVCPVSTQYDKVIETEGYVSELLGMPKRKENVTDFLSGGSSVLSLKLGRVDVRFHEPWSLRTFIDEHLGRSFVAAAPTSTSGVDNRVRQKLLRTLGYKVLAEINDVSVVMPTALIGTVLLTLRGRGVGKAELVRRTEWLINRVRAKGGRVAHFGAVPLPDVIDRGLEVLGPKLVGVLQDMPEPTYFAADRFQLSFYRNMTIHLFVSEALLCASMYTKVKQGGGPANQEIAFEDLKSQIAFLSTLFRGEFIFPSEGFAANLEKTIRGLESDQVIEVRRDEHGNAVAVGLAQEEREAGRENFDFYCFLIWPFVEATWLAAVSVMGLTPPQDQNGDAWVELTKAQESAQLLGKTLYHQGDLSYFEAVNKETLKNSFQRFQEEGVIEVVKSRDAKIPAKVRLSPAWTPARRTPDAILTAKGRLWDFIEKIASSRREGKNRRDGATVSVRVMRLTDMLGRRLFDDMAGMAGQTQARL